MLYLVKAYGVVVRADVLLLYVSLKFLTIGMYYYNMDRDSCCFSFVVVAVVAVGIVAAAAVAPVDDLL